METPYVFQSARLGFRNWRESDIDEMARISGDEKVMEFFPGVATKEQTTSFVQRMQILYAEKGFCYFAVDKLDTGEFIGFIGMMEQTYEASFTPCVDIGWRLKSSEWNKGYATEGARRCLEYAFRTLRLEKIYATAPAVNTKSQRIMTKIGMEKCGEFIHPRLKDDERLRNCVLYSCSR